MRNPMRSGHTRGPAQSSVSGISGMSSASASPPASPPTRAALLRDQARQARDWEALYAVLDAGQAAYDAGEVTLEEAESLTGYVADRSRQVPEDVGTLGDLLRSQPVIRVRSRLLGEVVVWVADAVQPPDTGEVVRAPHGAALVP